jgi:ABC-type polar amino acid transport system ATPase subunit
VADREVFMDGGIVVEQGPPDAFCANPRSDRARMFPSQVLKDGRRFVQADVTC